MQHVADGAQFAGVAVALAQQAGGRVAAAVGELREIHADDGEGREFGRQALPGLGGCRARRRPACCGRSSVLRPPDGERHEGAPAGGAAVSAVSPSASSRTGSVSSVCGLAVLDDRGHAAHAPYAAAFRRALSP